jgi:hypothetical protein
MRTQLVGLGVVLAIGVLAALASPAAHAESGRPSRQMMEAMGLGSLVVISDDEAMAVRGHGYKGGSHVVVSGNSFATVNGGPLGGAHSENAYSADGKHKASGSNSSYAGVADIWISTGGHKDKGNGGSKPRGDYGGMPGGGMNGGHPGGGYGGGGGGYGGGGPTVKIHAVVFFAGGSSSAHAW